MVERQSAIDPMQKMEEVADVERKRADEARGGLEEARADAEAAARRSSGLLREVAQCDDAARLKIQGLAGRLQGKPSTASLFCFSCLGFLLSFLISHFDSLLPAQALPAAGGRGCDQLRPRQP